LEAWPATTQQEDAAMSIATTIRLTGGTPALSRMMALAKDKAAMNEIIGRSIANLVKRHLSDYDKAHPNAMGGKRTHFFAQAARSTFSHGDATGATVSINHVGIRLQWLGGTVYPGRHASCHSGKPTRFLTIPAIAEAYGTHACEWTNLVFSRVEGRSALVEKEPGAAEKKGRKSKKQAQPSHARAIFWLIRKATIKPHPDVLPTEQAYIAAARASLKSYLTRGASY